MVVLKQRTIRVALWDNLKFLLIALVVVGHMVDMHTDQSNAFRSIFLFIYAFHMPLFIFISGLFHKEDRAGSRIIFYASIGFAYKIFGVILERMAGNIKPSFSLLSDGGISWFMFALAIFVGITYAIKNQNKHYILLCTVILGCFVGYDQSIGDYLYLSRVIVFYPFYLLGAMCNRKKIEGLKTTYRYSWLLGATIVLIWGALCWFGIDQAYCLRYLFTGRNPFYDGVFKYAPLIRLLCYALSMLLGLALILLMPNRYIPVITHAGARSMEVYFWHWKIFELIGWFVPISTLFFLGVPGKLVYIALGFVITIVIAFIPVFKFPMKQMRSMCFSHTIS